jgi:hypothetical protein
MSGSVLDAITMERRGIPSAPIGTEMLVVTTGRGMAKIQGVPDFPIVSLVLSGGNMTGWRNREELEKMAQQAAPQVERILLGKGSDV